MLITLFINVKKHYLLTLNNVILVTLLVGLFLCNRMSQNYITLH